MMDQSVHSLFLSRVYTTHFLISSANLYSATIAPRFHSYSIDWSKS